MSVFASVSSRKLFRIDLAPNISRSSLLRKIYPPRSFSRFHRPFCLIFLLNSLICSRCRGTRFAVSFLPATRCTLPRSFSTNLSRIAHRIIYFSFNNCVYIYIYGEHFSSQSTITRDSVRLFFPFRAKHFPSFTRTLSLSLSLTHTLSLSIALALCFSVIGTCSCLVTRSLFPLIDRYLYKSRINDILII